MHITMHDHNIGIGTQNLIFSKQAKKNHNRYTEKKRRREEIEKQIPRKG